MQKKNSMAIISIMMLTFLSLMYLKECHLKNMACELHKNTRSQIDFSCKEMSYSQLLEKIGTPENGDIKHFDHILSILIVLLTFAIVMFASYIHKKLRE